MEIRQTVDYFVDLIGILPLGCDDEEFHRELTLAGVEGSAANRVIQFVPIAFTRHVFRSSGVTFAENYFIVGADGKPISQGNVSDEPAFLKALEHCKEADLREEPFDYFVAVAARTGGYKSIKSMLDAGLHLDGIITLPPLIAG